VAKTKTPAEGNWAGFSGTEDVLSHLSELYRGTFVTAPDYGREKVVLLTQTVAETYVPLDISVAYAGQSGTPKPFLMIVEWVRVHGTWKMADGHRAAHSRPGAITLGGEKEGASPAPGECRDSTNSRPTEKAQHFESRVGIIGKFSSTES
jgi:hypothetical protein